MNTINKQTFRARENKHRVSVSLSILISVLLAIFSYILYSLVLFEFGKSLISIPITLMLQGTFLIVSRSNAYAQLIGYLVMENSMFLSYLFSGLPFIVEAGIILDILAVMFFSVILSNFGLIWVCIEATTFSSALFVAVENDFAALEAAWRYIIIFILLSP